MYRRLMLVAVLMLSARPLLAQSAPAGIDAGSQDYDRFHEFIDNTIKSPAWHIEAFGGALIDQVSKFPKEWDAESDPLLRRSAARFGQAFTASIIEAGTAEAMHYHVGYERCECSGAGHRIGHAIVHTFIVKHVDGHYVLNTPFLISRYGAATIANAWYPDSYKVGTVIGQGTASLGTAVGLNFLDEFGPDILHLFHRP